MTPDERCDLMARAFADRFGAMPTHWTRAPGRVDLMGSHTDYNHGFILTMTIDRETWIAARPRADATVRIASLDMPGESVFALADVDHDRNQRWADYVRGMACVVQDAGYRLQGWDGLVHTTVPVGAGLSSSAALEMAAGRMFAAIGGFDIAARELAVLGQRAENTFVGVNCGILDQYTSAVGAAGCALLLDARSVTSADVTLAPGIQVVICDTRTKRELTGSAYGERRAQCEAGAGQLAAFYPGMTHLRDITVAQFSAQAAALPATVARRCQFIVEENARVLEMAAALAAGDRDAIRASTAASFAGARDLYEIVVPEMQIMEAAMFAAPGCIGARQAGAGFGGCMVAFVAQEYASSFGATVAAAYQAASGNAARIYPVAPVSGAGLLDCGPA